jgi:hypothetical protein
MLCAHMHAASIVVPQTNGIASAVYVILQIDVFIMKVLPEGDSFTRSSKSNAYHVSAIQCYWYTLHL